MLTGFGARAEEPAWAHDVVYTVDVAGPVQGGVARRGRVLDNLDMVLDGDLERAAGWRGGRLHAYLLNNSGGAPNDLAGTLQGVNNIEVSRQRMRLYELWVEQTGWNGRAALLAGLYDLNSEFYATEASGDLIAPPFGIGSEIAATGNGPSIFPSTALGLRLRIGGEGRYLQGAALNAQAGALGTDDGPDLDFDSGALLIAEAGATTGQGRIALGAWRYTHDQPDLRDVDAAGEPVGRDAHGAYLLAERALAGDPQTGRVLTGFLRAGLSDGDTTPFAGGWQAGLRLDRPLSGRPGGVLSVGVHQGVLSDKYRTVGRAQGVDIGGAEQGLEITYADSLGPRLRVQPDLQYVRRPAGDRAAKDVIVAGLRLTVDLD